MVVVVAACNQPHLLLFTTTRAFTGLRRSQREQRQIRCRILILTVYSATSMSFRWRELRSSTSTICSTSPTLKNRCVSTWTKIACCSTRATGKIPVVSQEEAQSIEHRQIKHTLIFNNERDHSHEI